jgi:hypothetical protein
MLSSRFVASTFILYPQLEHSLFDLLLLGAFFAQQHSQGKHEETIYTTFRIVGPTSPLFADAARGHYTCPRPMNNISSHYSRRPNHRLNLQHFKLSDIVAPHFGTSERRRGK